MIDISVIICTYNRAELLGDALGSLCQQSLTADHFEIIVVDNGSTDDTGAIIRDNQKRYPRHIIRFLNVTEQGLGIARNRGAHQANGKYVAYLDDDACAPSNWLEKALVHMTEGDRERFICLGGPIEPFYSAPRPAWFKDDYERHSWGHKKRLLRKGESFSGSNMIWHKKSLLELGGFAEHIGVKGSKLSMGEETAVFAKAWQRFKEPVFLYDPGLIVRHCVPSFKTKVSYRLKRAFVAGQVAIFQKNEGHGKAYYLLGAVKGLLTRSLMGLWHFRRYPHWQNWAVEEGQPIMINLGTILAVFGIEIPVSQA